MDGLQSYSVSWLKAKPKWDGLEEGFAAGTLKPAHHWNISTELQQLSPQD